MSHIVDWARVLLLLLLMDIDQHGLHGRSILDDAATWSENLAGTRPSATTGRGAMGRCTKVCQYLCGMDYIFSVFGCGATGADYPHEQRKKEHAE